MEPLKDARRSFSEIHVGPNCHVQTAGSRYGPKVVDDIKAFVYEGPESTFNMDFDDEDDEDEDEQQDEESDTDTADYIDEFVNLLNWDEPDDPVAASAAGAATAEYVDGSQEVEFAHPVLGFPRMARLRCNLTAMSQRYNLYFVAYQDKIHVFQPKRAPNILPPASLILAPKTTKAAKSIRGAIDRLFGHQMNSIMVGNLGDLEILFFAFDDGDVGAYYTHTIARFASQAGTTSRQVTPKEFFHENVGLSAWGLAIHEQSRLLAVSSNRHEVTVFAFATSDNPVQDQPPEEDTSPEVWSGQTALELEKHFQSRTRTWRIVLPTGTEGQNIPSIAFCDDETGYADKVVAFDVEGNTWIFDIWKIGSFPILHRPLASKIMPSYRQVGWGVLVLPDSSFRQTNTLNECLGLPASEIIRYEDPGRPLADPGPWLDTTCSLYYVRDQAPDPDTFLKPRPQGPTYIKVHAGGSLADAGLGSSVDHGDDEEDSEMLDTGSEDDEMDDSFDASEAGYSQEQRWKALTKLPRPPGAMLTDVGEVVQMSRTIVPSFGETPPLEGDAIKLIAFSEQYFNRQEHTKSIDFKKAEFPQYMAKNMTMLRTLSTDIELQPFDPRGTGIICKSVLTHHNHHGRRNEPWDLARYHSERVSMVLHVPELSLVVAGSLNGRVTLLSLTKTNKRIHGLAVKRGFRVDWVLPRKEEEKKRIRPLCALHGIAISPVPDPKARGLNLRGRHGRLPHSYYRLILHYVDHTILMYDITRRVGDEDLMIF